jgi:hypothetical protein
MTTVRKSSHKSNRTKTPRNASDRAVQKAIASWWLHTFQAGVVSATELVTIHPAFRNPDDGQVVKLIGHKVGGQLDVRYLARKIEPDPVNGHVVFRLEGDGLYLMLRSVPGRVEPVEGYFTVRGTTVNYLTSPPNIEDMILNSALNSASVN